MLNKYTSCRSPSHTFFSSTNVQIHFCIFFFFSYFTVSSWFFFSVISALSYRSFSIYLEEFLSLLNRISALFFFTFTPTGKLQFSFVFSKLGGVQPPVSLSLLISATCSRLCGIQMGKDRYLLLHLTLQ